MAELDSDTYTAQVNASTNAANMIPTAEFISGKGAFAQFKWTVPAGTGAADTVNLGFVPSGMAVIPGSTVTTSNAAGANTIELELFDSQGVSEVVAETVSLNTVGTALISTMRKSTTTSNTRRTLVATLSGAVTAGREIYFNLSLVNSN